MPTKHFRLIPGGEKVFTATYRRGFKNFVLTNSGQTVFHTENLRKAKPAPTRQLTTGEVLTCQYVKKTFVGAGAEVTIQGVPLLGSAASGDRMLKQAGTFMLLFGFIMTAIGLAFVAGDDEALTASGAVMLGAGIGFGVLAVLAFSLKPIAGHLGLVLYLVFFVAGILVSNGQNLTLISVIALIALIMGSVGATRLRKQLEMGRAMTARGIQVASAAPTQDELQPYGA